MFISTTLIFLLTLALTPVLEAASSAAQRSLCTQMLCLVNAYRNQYGAPFLALSETLMVAAYTQASFMGQNNVMSHTGQGGSDPTGRILAAGFRNALYTGENVAFGQLYLRQVMQDWWNSPSHQANILDPNYTHFGCGLYWSRDGTPFWDQSFAGDGATRTNTYCPLNANIEVL